MQRKFKSDKQRKAVMAKFKAEKTFKQLTKKTLVDVRGVKDFIIGKPYIVSTLIKGTINGKPVELIKSEKSFFTKKAAVKFLNTKITQQ